MKLKKLKELINGYPDDMDVCIEDNNFDIHFNFEPTVGFIKDGETILVLRKE